LFIHYLGCLWFIKKSH